MSIAQPLPIPDSCHRVPADDIDCLCYESIGVSLEKLANISEITALLANEETITIKLASQSVGCSPDWFAQSRIQLSTRGKTLTIRQLITFLNTMHYLHHNPIAHRLCHESTSTQFLEHHFQTTGYGIEEYRDWMDSQGAKEIETIDTWCARDMPDIEKIHCASGEIDVHYAT